MNLPTKLIEEAEEISKNRPKANPKFDQVYMIKEYMLSQIFRIQKKFEGKRIVFLGDGDCTSLFVCLFMKYGIIRNVLEITVLDFDKRVLNYINQYLESESSCSFRTLNYNIVLPVPDDLKSKFDFFYINPPYGSKNNGASIIAWIHRCIDLTTCDASGCIIAPYSYNLLWTQKVMMSIQTFLLKQGFVLVEVISAAHLYENKKDPALSSSSLMVKRIKQINSIYTKEKLPYKFTKNLYGKETRIPLYIEDDGELLGNEVFWEGLDEKILY